ncbi:MAG: glycosyl transferase group 1 [Frankiales bacterium]|nr:glycosyl transferase group 1 [Frankiales bacterium]
MSVSPPISYGMLSTYPPTQCGLATFSKALVAALNSDVGVVRILDAPEPFSGDEVVHQWVRGRAGGAVAAAMALNDYDVAIIQHEFGIFGGVEGVDVLDVLAELWVPTIAVLHTVLVTPSKQQRDIIEQLVARCVSVVTMTQTARRRLIENYSIDPSKVTVIPHGAVDNRVALTSIMQAAQSSAHADPAERRQVILTWGLLGEGKGIEWGIEAMADLIDLKPAPEYRVVGQTHPKVLEHDGERYRDSLVDRVRVNDVSGAVSFDARYLDEAELRRQVREADVVLLPYDSLEQVTSGVLIEAVTAGKPVVSTGFPHARELLSSGAGLVVDRQDPTAIARALRRIFTEPGLAEAMSAEARRIAPGLLWPAVAEQYRALAGNAAASRPRDHRLATA